MKSITQILKQAFKNLERCELSDFHIKKVYNKMVQRGLGIVKIYSTREKVFISHYIPSDLTFRFDNYGDAEVCANLMKKYHKNLEKKWR
jgi:hypothetical protein